MFNKIKSGKNVFLLMLIMFSIFLILPNKVYALEKSNSKEQVYYYNDIVNTGLDNGYSGNDTIKKDDPHYGWSLGKFCIKGFSAKKEDSYKNLVFLKNVKNNSDSEEGNKITLSFFLEQNIDKLNGKDNMKIFDDENGFDETLGTDQNKFGRGTLIVRKTDYTNQKEEPLIHSNFLKLNAVKGKEKIIDFCEEGDYEVALDYEIVVEDNLVVIPTPKYYNYRMSFKFSVRNGNCMVYLMNGKTKSEIQNTSIVENGFYIDLARSRYLDINLKRKTLVNGSDELTEDVKFNGPAEEGKIYDKDGIYEITVKNNYTGESTEKKVYVGKDKVLKAYVQNKGMSIKDIRAKVSSGATISDDGVITMPVVTSTVVKPKQISEQVSVPDSSTAKKSEASKTSETAESEVKTSGESDGNIVIAFDPEKVNMLIIISIIVSIVVGAVTITVIFVKRKNRHQWFGVIINENS